MALADTLLVFRSRKILLLLPLALTVGALVAQECSPGAAVLEFGYRIAFLKSSDF